jgi:ABC-type polysaccharide/polyol phosphate transport system ATPase subunit
MASAIQRERVTKRYRAGRSRTIVDLIGSALDRARGRAQDVHSLTRGRIDANIWALRDVSFDVPEAAGLGVIGRNGAGKTTLLKLISRVTWPTSGQVRVAGRVVSLIELGAGFHPELTGRENTRRRPVRAHATRYRSPVRSHRRVCGRRAADRHADETLLVGPLRAPGLQRGDSRQP